MSGPATAVRMGSLSHLFVYEEEVYFSDKSGAAVHARVVRKLTCTWESSAPTEEPSAVPSMVPSAVPSLSPSSVPTTITAAPTFKVTPKPTKQPTRQPSFKPTIEFVGVGFTSKLVIDDVHIEENLVAAESVDRRVLSAAAEGAAGALLLMEVSDQAIVATVSSVLGIERDAVTIQVERIVANVTNVATVLVELRIIASAEGFASYDACYQHFIALLSESVGSLAIYEKLREVAEDMGAYELYSITAVNITSFENQGAIDTAVTDRDDISEGDFAGVVIGIVVAFLVLIALCYCCVVRRGHITSEENGSAGAAAPVVAPDSLTNV